TPPPSVTSRPRPRRVGSYGCVSGPVRRSVRPRLRRRRDRCPEGPRVRTGRARGREGSSEASLSFGPVTAVDGDAVTVPARAVVTANPGTARHGGPGVPKMDGGRPGPPPADVPSARADRTGSTVIPT